jgi:tetratricopeptide (TPR) repeat protein
MKLGKTCLAVGLTLAACSRGGDPVGSGEPPPAPATARGSAGPRDASGSGAMPPHPAADTRFHTEALGALRFELSEGTPPARAAFLRGLAALHSFWYDEALRQFQAAMAADPEMNMAYWGVAMSHCKLLWGEDDVAAARRVLARMPNPDRLSPREQAWVMAAVDLVRPSDVRTSRERFAVAMETLHAQFGDDESATFLALALLSTTRPEDPDTVAVRERAARLALAVYERNPQHPGAAHYLIHAYDTPGLAARALPQARAYAQIAPAAFHARHMPAHIFTRLGMWPEAIASCRSAWAASVEAAQRERLSANHHDFHSLNWIIELSLEAGQRAEADRALAQFGAAVRAGLGRQHRAAYASQVASYLARTGEWDRIDQLLAPLAAPPAEDASATPRTGLGPAPVLPGLAARAARAGVAAPPGAAPPELGGDAATTRGAPSHCAPSAAPASSPLDVVEQIAVLEARTRAASERRDLPGTRRALAALDTLRAKLRPYLESTQPRDLLKRLEASHERRKQAHVARARGDARALLAILQRSLPDAAAEAAVGEASPSGFLLEEEIGDLHLRLGDASAAAAAYAAALRAVPGRARSLLGAARAAQQLGDRAAARAAYTTLLAHWPTAEPSTVGLSEARAAVAAP